MRNVALYSHHRAPDAGHDLEVASLVLANHARCVASVLYSLHSQGMRSQSLRLDRALDQHLNALQGSAASTDETAVWEAGRGYKLESGSRVGGQHRAGMACSSDPPQTDSKSQPGGALEYNQIGRGEQEIETIALVKVLRGEDVVEICPEDLALTDIVLSRPPPPPASLTPSASLFSLPAKPVPTAQQKSTGRRRRAASAQQLRALKVLDRLSRSEAADAPPLDLAEDSGVVAQGAPAQTSLVGRRVVVNGLVQDVGLNGRQGTIVEVQEGVESQTRLLGENGSEQTRESSRPIRRAIVTLDPAAPDEQTEGPAEAEFFNISFDQLEFLPVLQLQPPAQAGTSRSGDGDLEGHSQKQSEVSLDAKPLQEEAVMWQCMHGCGYQGSFAIVQKHESLCSVRPRTQLPENSSQTTVEKDVQQDAGHSGAEENGNSGRRAGSRGAVGDHVSIEKAGAGRQMVSVKVKAGAGEYLRVRAKSFADLVAALRSRKVLGMGEEGGVELTYIDGDGDEVLMRNEGDFAEAVRVLRDGGHMPMRISQRGSLEAPGNDRADVLQDSPRFAAAALRSMRASQQAGGRQGILDPFRLVRSKPSLWRASAKPKPKSTKGHNLAPPSRALPAPVGWAAEAGTGDIAEEADAVTALEERRRLLSLRRQLMTPDGSLLSGDDDLERFMHLRTHTRFYPRPSDSQIILVPTADPAGDLVNPAKLPGGSQQHVLRQPMPRPEPHQPWGNDDVSGDIVVQTVLSSAAKEEAGGPVTSLAPRSPPLLAPVFESAAETRGLEVGCGGGESAQRSGEAELRATMVVTPNGSVVTDKSPAHYKWSHLPVTHLVQSSPSLPHPKPASLLSAEVRGVVEASKRIGERAAEAVLREADEVKIHAAVEARQLRIAAEHEAHAKLQAVVVHTDLVRQNQVHTRMEDSARPHRARECPASALSLHGAPRLFPRRPEESLDGRLQKAFARDDQRLRLEWGRAAGGGGVSLGYVSDREHPGYILSARWRGAGPHPDLTHSSTHAPLPSHQQPAVTAARSVSEARPRGPLDRDTADTKGFSLEPTTVDAVYSPPTFCARADGGIKAGGIKARAAKKQDAELAEILAQRRADVEADAAGCPPVSRSSAEHMPAMRTDAEGRKEPGIVGQAAFVDDSVENPLSLARASVRDALAQIDRGQNGLEQGLGSESDPSVTIEAQIAELVCDRVCMCLCARACVRGCITLPYKLRKRSRAKFCAARFVRWSGSQGWG